MLHHKSPGGCKILHHTAINECKTCGDTIWYLCQIRAVQHMLILLAWIKTWCYFTYSLPDTKSRLLGRGARSNSWFCCLFAAFLRFAGHTMPSEGDPLWRSVLPLCQRLPAAPFAPGRESSSKTHRGRTFSPKSDFACGPSALSPAPSARSDSPWLPHSLPAPGTRPRLRFCARTAPGAAPRGAPHARGVFGGYSEGLLPPARRGSGSAGSGPREP